MVHGLSQLLRVPVGEIGGNVHRVDLAGQDHAADLNLFAAEIRKRIELIDVEVHVDGARYGVEHADDVFADAAQLIEIVTVDFHDELAVHIENLICDRLDDRLADMDFETRQFAKTRGHAADQVVRRPARGPGVARAKGDVGFDVDGVHGSVPSSLRPVCDTT